MLERRKSFPKHYYPLNAYIVQFMKLRYTVSLVVRVLKGNLGFRAVQCQGQTVMTTRKRGLLSIGINANAAWNSVTRMLHNCIM